MNTPTLADIADQLLTLRIKLDAALAILRRIEPPPVVMQRDVLTVEEFAKEMKRSKDWVYDQIRLRRLRPLKLGKPYQIPRSEVVRLQRGV